LRDRHVHHIGPQPLARQFEAGLRAGGVLEKHVDLRHARQHIRLFHRAAVQIDIAVGQIQHGANLVRGQVFDAEQMAGAEGHRILLSLTGQAVPCAAAAARHGAVRGAYCKSRGVRQRSIGGGAAKALPRAAPGLACGHGQRLA
jgi:hypothetical protein